MTQNIEHGGGEKLITLHATAVSFKQSAVLIKGPPGAGKSALALQLLALGFELIADDQVTLSRDGHSMIASRPSALPQAIEARGFGLISVICGRPAPVRLVVDLARTSSQRFAETELVELLGCHMEVMIKIDAAHFPATILSYLSGAGRFESDLT